MDRRRYPILALKESSTQSRVVQFIKVFYPKTLMFSIPNGAHTSAKNRLRLSKEGLLPGVPDLCILEKRKGFHGLFIEFKTDEGKLSEEQQKVIAQLGANGFLCFVARHHETAIKLIEDYLNE